MKAIETRYKGYRFRSRLEARWAVFFDALNLQWSYEEEGYKMPDGTYYLPDFKVTNLDGCVQFYEIKPSGQTHDDKFACFAESLRNTASEMADPQAVMLSGDPYEYLIEQRGAVYKTCPRCLFIGEPAYGSNFSQHAEFGCAPCDQNTPCGGGHEIQQGPLCLYTTHKGVVVTEETEFLLFVNSIKIASQKARSARFEHGECP